MAKNEGYKALNKSNHIMGLIGTIRSHTTPKAAKEAALARIREIEARAGVTLYGKYNGGGALPQNPSELARIEAELEETRD